jgi:predicted Zn-dependent protease with MMP-like domain
MDTGAFERMVADALDGVPEPFRRYLDTVEVIVEPEPSPRQRRTMGLRPRDTLYGLYEGMTVPQRLSVAGGVDGALPSVVTVFRRPLAADFPDEEDLRREIRRTVFHELAHHFGIEDARLEELGAY